MITASPITNRASAAMAPMMTIRRRARAGSTTTSVSEEWIDVSLFMMSMPVSNLGLPQCQLY